MGNPYYIPKPENPLGGLTRNIMALAEMKQRSDIARMGLEQDQARLAADQEYRTQTLAQGEDQNRLAREKHLAERPDLRPYDAKTHVKARMAVRQLGLEGSGIENFLESAQENGYTSGQLYSGLRTPQMQKQLKKHIEDQIIKNSDAPGFIGSPQEEQLNDLLEALDGENYNAFVDGLFPEVAQYNAAMEAEAGKKAAQNAPYKVGQIISRKGPGGREFQGTVKGYDEGGQPVVDWQDVTAPKEPKEPRLIAVDNGDGTVTYTPADKLAGKTVPKKGAEEKRPTEAQLVNAESVILNPQATKPEVTPQIDFFNRHSDKPYAYKIEKTARYVPGTKQKIPGTSGEELKRVPLPVVNGKQVTARDVSDTAAARGMTYDQALNAILTLSKGKK